VNSLFTLFELLSHLSLSPLVLSNLVASGLCVYYCVGMPLSGVLCLCFALVRVGLFGKHLFGLEEGNPSKLRGLLNVEKLRKIYHVLKYVLPLLLFSRCSL
jgi:hypothetical protein